MVSNEVVRDLASGPLRSVRSIPNYYVNGYKFHTRTYEPPSQQLILEYVLKGRTTVRHLMIILGYWTRIW